MLFFSVIGFVVICQIKKKNRTKYIYNILLGEVLLIPPKLRGVTCKQTRKINGLIVFTFLVLAENNLIHRPLGNS